MGTSRASFAGAFFLLFVSCLSAYEARMTTTTVKVVDESGEAVQGASVAVAYSPLHGDKYVTGKGVTNENGIYRFSGIAYYQVFSSAEKDGYYQSRKAALAYLLDEDEKMQPNDPVIELVLKKVEDPVAMYAHQRFLIKVPEFNQPLEYDLFLLDWLPPHGVGKQADVVFEVNGYYESNQDHQSTLFVRFPNEGDGIIAFDGHCTSGSQLVSPQVAPEAGYVSKYTHSKAAFDSGEKDPGGSAIIKTTGMKEASRNYIFRIRTRFDENGEIKAAYYGKLYEAFDFGGVRNGKSSIVLGDYYLNPTSLHRSLEYRVGSNLFEDLKSFEKPSRP